jgi:membrane fusion protein, multidrug efflux system
MLVMYDAAFISWHRFSALVELNTFMRIHPRSRLLIRLVTVFLMTGGLTQAVIAQSSAQPASGPKLSLSPSLNTPPPPPARATKASDKVAPTVAVSAAAGTATSNPPSSSATSVVRVLLAPDMETLLLAQTVARITSLNGTLGGRVSRGQLVVGMDCSENAAKLKMSQAELASARETYDSKVRLKGLDAAGEIEVALAAAAVARADGQIEMTKAQIQNCSVYAPFSGRIVKMHVKPFQGVNAGQPLFEVVSEGAPRLRLNVPSKWLKTIKVGTTFQVEIDETGKTYKAAISAINARVDAVAQTVEIEARVTGRFAELLPGMSGSARFAIAP